MRLIELGAIKAPTSIHAKIEFGLNTISTRIKLYRRDHVQILSFERVIYLTLLFFWEAMERRRSVRRQEEGTEHMKKIKKKKKIS